MRLATLVFAPLLAAGCSFGDPTGATCPTDSTLTYANFGQQFMAAYCTDCHSKTPKDGTRHGAPRDVNFDTQADVQDHLDDIDRAAGKGPDATNTFMPDPDAPKDFSNFAMPTDTDREQLAEWIACKAP
jgi:uncharacterized membrane protein